MKLFYGVQATGRGHLSRYLVARDILERAGHTVYGFASGPSLPDYARSIERFSPGPSFFIKNNRIDLLRSAAYNARHIWGYRRSMLEIAQLLKSERFDDVMVDFEPLTARGARRAKRDFTIFDNQTLALLKFDYPEEVQSAVRAMKVFVQQYYGSLQGVKRILTYSFAPLKAQLANQVIIPPCVRNEVTARETATGSHILFYSSIGEVPEGLIDFARANPSVEVRAYVKESARNTPVPENLQLPSSSNQRFLDDFATCRTFVANAGFESLAEAIWFRKPVVIVPIRGQWEQRINSFLIRHFKIGLTAESFGRETFEMALRHEQPASEEVRDWVTHGRSMLESALLERG